jgi:hypothetical protein
MCTAAELRVHAGTPATLTQRCIGHMSSRNAGAVALVIVLGLVVGTLGLVAADLYAVGVLILFLGGVGAAVLAGEYLIRYLSSRRPPA